MQMQFFVLENFFPPSPFLSTSALVLSFVASSFVFAPVFLPRFFKVLTRYSIFFLIPFQGKI